MYIKLLMATATEWRLYFLSYYVSVLFEFYYQQLFLWQLKSGGENMFILFVSFLREREPTHLLENPPVNPWPKLNPRFVPPQSK